MYLISLSSGGVLRVLPHGRGDAATMAAAGALSRDFAAATLSGRGEWAFALCADGALCSFQLGGADAPQLPPGAPLKPAAVMPTHAGDALGVACHPHRNLVATFAGDGTLKLWKP